MTHGLSLSRYAQEGKEQKNPSRNQSRAAAACFQGKSAYFAFEASGIEPVPLAFKASVMSTAPVVLHNTTEGSQM